MWPFLTTFQLNKTNPDRYVSSSTTQSKHKVFLPGMCYRTLRTMNVNRACLKLSPSWELLFDLNSLAMLFSKLVESRPLGNEIRVEWLRFVLILGYFCLALCKQHSIFKSIVLAADMYLFNWTGPNNLGLLIYWLWSNYFISAITLYIYSEWMKKFSL